MRHIRTPNRLSRLSSTALAVVGAMLIVLLPLGLAALRWAPPAIADEPGAWLDRGRQVTELSGCTGTDPVSEDGLSYSNRVIAPAVTHAD